MSSEALQLFQNPVEKYEDTKAQLFQLFPQDIAEEIEAFIQLAKQKAFDHIKVFQFLKSGLQYDVHNVITALNAYSEEVNKHAALLRNEKAQRQEQTFFKIGASVLGGLVAGPFGALAARGVAGSLFNVDSKIGKSMQLVAEAWDNYTECLHEFMIGVEEKYLHILMSLYGGLFLSVSKKLRNANIEIKAINLMNMKYVLGVTEQERVRLEKWVEETVSSIQSALKNDIEQANIMADQFYHYVNLHPIMARAVIHTSKSVKYYANMMKFAALATKAESIRTKDMKSYIAFVNEIFKQLPMFMDDRDLENMGLPTQRKWRFILFITISLQTKIMRNVTYFMIMLNG